jgi:hypothetical protein
VRIKSVKTATVFAVSILATTVAAKDVVSSTRVKAYEGECLVVNTIQSVTVDSPNTPSSILKSGGKGVSQQKLTTMWRKSSMLAIDLECTAESETKASAQGASTTHAQNAEIARAFLEQDSGIAKVTLGKTLVALPYAVQEWGNEYSGGEALLRQSPSGKWALVDSGGGEWDVLGLIEQGVPRKTAEQLIAAIHNGILPVPNAAPIAVPAGRTITIRTPHGDVVPNNFYLRAEYFAPGQHAAVIRQTPEYAVVYDVSDGVFSLFIFSISVDAGRRTAEAAFLEMLGIQKQSACKLRVYELPSGLAPGKHSGTSFPLSFCTGHDPKKNGATPVRANH